MNTTNKQQDLKNLTTYKITDPYLLSVLWMQYTATDGGVGSTSSAVLASASLYSFNFATMVGGVTLGGIVLAPLEPRVNLDGCFIYTSG